MKIFLIFFIIVSFFINAVLCSKQATEDLLAACTAPQDEDDVDAAKRAISNGADINTKEERSGQTPLMAAVLRGKINIATYLLEEAGADPNIGERSGFLPPDGAAFQGRPMMMQMLIDNGLKVDYFGHDGFTPFHRACWGPREGHTEVVKVMIKNGIDPNHLSQSFADHHPSQTCLEMTTNEETINLLNNLSSFMDEPENEKSEESSSDNIANKKKIREKIMLELYDENPLFYYLFIFTSRTEVVIMSVIVVLLYLFRKRLSEIGVVDSILPLRSTTSTVRNRSFHND